MVGPTDVVQPPVTRAGRARDAALWAVSSVGGARRCGCAAAGAPECFSGLLGARAERGPQRLVERLREERDEVADPALVLAPPERFGLGGVAAEDRRVQ